MNARVGQNCLRVNQLLHKKFSVDLAGAICLHVYAYGWMESYEGHVCLILNNY